MRVCVRDGECQWGIWMLPHAFITRQGSKNDNDATPAQCNRPNPDTEKPLSAIVIGLHILQRLQCEGRRIKWPQVT